VVDEAARHVEAGGRLGHDPAVARAGGIERLDLRLSSLPMSKQRLALPRHAHGPCSGEALLMGSTEPDLFDEAKLLRLAAEDLDEPLGSARGDG
jgi:hypothetical protein